MFEDDEIVAAPKCQKEFDHRRKTKYQTNKTNKNTFTNTEKQHAIKIPQNIDLLTRKKK